jgi:pyruvate/2-oxoacid:ferredoxin oxidoreductase beta subunit
VQALGEFLNNYKIGMWKFYKFMPLRETAEKNKSFFEISDKEFENFQNNRSIQKV